MMFSGVFNVNEVAQKWPALEGLQAQDPLCMFFMKKTLTFCPTTFMLDVENSEDLSASLSLVQLTLRKVTSVYVEDVCTVNCLETQGTIIRHNCSERDSFEQIVYPILQKFSNKPHLHVVRQRERRFVLSALLHKNLSGLSIGHSQRSWVISSVVPFCPSLTHLCIMNQTIDRSVVQALSKAVQDDRLPSLSHLSLINCKRTPYRNSSNPPLGLSAIFKSKWPQI